MNKQKRRGHHFLVGSVFDSGQDVLWDILDEPFAITPPYIHFGNGNKIFIEEVDYAYGNNKYSENLAKKLAKSISENNYRKISGQEKIDILQIVYGVGTFMTLHKFNGTVKPGNLVVYEVLI